MDGVEGIDSWYNEGMQEFANYLLLDFFDSYRQDLLRYKNFCLSTQIRHFILLYASLLMLSHIE